MKEPAWYHKKGYAHFDLPLSAEAAQAYVSDPKRVACRSFYPFIAFNIVRRRYKSADGKGFVKKKPRPIRIASHLDGYIFAYYASEIAKKYEEHIARTPLARCVLAYRSGLGSNIEFAKDAFDEVDRRGTCVAIAMDLEGFFDSIDHGVLKKQWANVLGTANLPPDHFAVYRAMTRYAWVERDACFDALTITDRPPKPLCRPDTFRAIVRGSGLINVNSKGFGIPQGSPMSAVLSNVYMIPFDREMAALAYAIRGYYRRYCDDILWIVDIEDEALVLQKVVQALAKVGVELKVNEDKNVISVFEMGTLESGSDLLQYLGFTYDGKQRLIRSQTLSRFWRKVVYGVRAAKHRAEKAAKAGGDGRLYKRKLYRRFTHLGRKNFLTYARRSYDLMEDADMREQIKGHWGRVQKELEKPLK